MNPPRRRPLTKRVSIARRARHAARRARREWEALALRLGIEAVAGAAELRQRKLTRVLESLACGAYRVDAQAVAVHLIDRLLKQARSPQH